MADDDKSQRATPRRREKAREQGQIVRSRELPAALALLGVLLFLRWGWKGWIPVWKDVFRDLLARTASSDMQSITPLVHEVTWTVLRWTAAPLALAWSISAAGQLAQGGLVIAPQALQLRGGKLNPVNNLSRIFSVAGLSPLLKSLFPLSFLAYLGISILLREWMRLVHSSQFGLAVEMDWLRDILFEFAWKGSLVLLVWSGVDYALQKINFERSLRMSKQEVRDEMKDLDGNPQTKGRIKRRRREIRRRQMLQQVSRATVIITNPDEYAVALEYLPEKMAAPLVVAKGRGLLAQKIKREARWYEIPIVENVPLAQALYRSVEVGGSIPAKLYTAVAEVLAFIYRAQARLREEREAAARKAAERNRAGAGASAV